MNGFRPVSLRVDYGSAGNAVVDHAAPVFTWGAEHDGSGQFQSGYRITVRANKLLWDSGWVESRAQQAEYAGAPLPEAASINWELTLRDRDGKISTTESSSFQTALLREWPARWITAAQDKPGSAMYFRREFSVRGELASAVLFVCGIGYQHVTVNGENADCAVLQPLHSNYAKKCYYTTLPVETLLSEGENCVGIVVGDGWRRNDAEMFSHALGDRKIEFYGAPQLTALLRLEYADGSITEISTDESWQCGSGGTVCNSLFGGETFDARIEPKGFDIPGFAGEGFSPAVLAASPGGKMCAQTVEPIMRQQAYHAVSKTVLEPGKVLFDFGVNIAGYCELTIPADIPVGTEIALKHYEDLDEFGMPDAANLRGAAQTDRFITDGAAHCWSPRFTYHGFRYVVVEGWPGIPDEALTAVSVYTDIDNGSRFRCGSALINAFQEIILQTERDNLHGIATDCPQRDERMGWMNDATVRFEETPFNFDIGRIFPKIVDDIRNEQSPDGAITCTAPFVFGSRPADPVSTSFLVAGEQALLHTGNVRVISEAYPSYRAWNRCLADIAAKNGGIVDYTCYGDWAGPQDCCEGEDGARSVVTPGILLSTGYHFYNYMLLEKFAEVLNLPEDADAHRESAEAVKKAFLARWWDPDSGIVGTGSQACQAFALWCGILPESGRKLAAAKMREAVVNAGMRITTGNLCTRYLLDMLAEYGYVDDAYALLTREEYPSWGYMLQNDATTVWERFELKKNGGMNSHNHPMFGAAGAWFYRYLAGISPVSPGWEKMRVKPHIPEKLLFAEAVVDSCRGMIRVRWQKQYGKTVLLADIPFGCEAEIVLPDKTVAAGSGLHTFILAEDTD